MGICGVYLGHRLEAVMELIKMYVPEQMKKRLKEEADRKGIPLSEVIRGRLQSTFDDKEG